MVMAYRILATGVTVNFKLVVCLFASANATDKETTVVATSYQARGSVSVHTSHD